VGLEAAPSDQERSLPMGSTDTQTTATGMEVGDGMDNTSILLSVIGVTSKTYQTTKPRMKTIIINDHESYDEEVGRDYKGLDGTYAALSCIYRQTENNHWFLPSKKELGLLYDTYLSLLHYQSGAEDDEVKGLSLIKHEALSQWLRDTLKGYYWSSSVDYKNNIFWGQTFDPHHNSKFLLPGSFNINVRCVRAF